MRKKISSRLTLTFKTMKRKDLIQFKHLDFEEKRAVSVFISFSMYRLPYVCCLSDVDWMFVSYDLCSFREVRQVVASQTLFYI